MHFKQLTVSVVLLVKFLVLNKLLTQGVSVLKCVLLTQGVSVLKCVLLTQGHLDSPRRWSVWVRIPGSAKKLVKFNNNCTQMCSTATDWAQVNTTKSEGSSAICGPHT